MSRADRPGSRPPNFARAGFTARFALGLILGLALVVALAIGLAPTLGRWVAPRPLEVLPTLARIGEPAEIAEVATAEYYGEVIVTLDEVMDSVAAPANIARYYTQLRTGAVSDTAALEFSLIRQVGGNDPDLLAEIRRRPWSEFQRGYVRRLRLARLRTAGVEIAYLARGRVDVTFDLERVWSGSECEGPAGRVALDGCPLLQDTLILHVPASARRVEGVVNPFLDYDRRIPGYVVLEERDAVRARELIPLVRQLARCKLERKAVERGILDLGDLSLEQGLEGLILAFGRRVHVIIHTPRPTTEPLCTRLDTDVP